MQCCVRSRRFVSWAELLLSPAATAEIVIRAIVVDAAINPVGHSGLSASSTPPLSTLSRHSTPTPVAGKIDTPLSLPGVLPSRSLPPLSTPEISSGSTSSSTPQRATLILPVGHPDCRRRRRRHHHFLRGRQPCGRYIHFLIGRYRHSRLAVCCWPATVGSSTRQLSYRATLEWLTSLVGSPRRVVCRAPHATRLFSLYFHTCLSALPTSGGYPATAVRTTRSPSISDAVLGRPCYSLLNSPAK